MIICQIRIDETRNIESEKSLAHYISNVIEMK